MSEINYERSIEEMIKALKGCADLSYWKKDRNTAPLLTLLSHLDAMPKASIPSADLERVKNQVLDRISIPVESEAGWFATLFPRFVKIGIASIGSLLIVISLGLGTAVAALESVPGQTIYPLKKAVENVQLKLASDGERTTLQLRFAYKRIEELERILEQQEQGKISEEEVQKVISDTVRDLKETTTEIASTAANEPKVVNKLTDLSNKIKSASSQTEGEAKAELEKAIEATKVSQEDAIKNIENAGLVVENQPITITGSVTASGTITAVSKSAISIGTSQFLLSENTEYFDLTKDDLKTGLIVDIEGEIKDNKTYAVKIRMIKDPATQEEETSGAETTTQTPEVIEIPESQ